MPVYDSRSDPRSWMRQKPQRAAVPKPVPKKDTGGSSIEQLLKLMTQLRGGGGSAAADYAARAAGETRAADVAHQRELDYLGKQQKYQADLADWQSRRDAYEADKQRRWETEQTAKALERERQLGVSELLQGRQERYAQMAPQDAIRATMFALGLGQGTEPFRTRATQLRTTLAPLAGAEETRAGQESALSRLLNRVVGIGQYGVTGLGSAQQAARAFTGGGSDVQNLLSSAFGLGTTRQEAGAPGMSRGRLQELVSEVTPTGGMY